MRPQQPPVAVDCRPFPAQFKGASIPKWTSFMVAASTGLGPAIIMLFCLDGTVAGGFRAMFLMHFVAMGVLPVVLVKSFFHDELYYKCWWNSQLQFQLSYHFKWSLILGIIACVYGVIGGQFVLLRIFAGPEGPLALIHRLRENIDVEDPRIIACGLWFSFINPLFEEFFWRVWLFKELGERCFKKADEARDVNSSPPRGQIGAPKKSRAATIELPRSPTMPTSTSDNAYLPAESAQRTTSSDPLLNHRKVAYNDVQVTYVGQALISLLYTSYHLVVIWVYTHDYQMTLLGGADLWVYGMIFGLLRSDARFGWLGAVGLHTGLDLALVLSFVLW